MSLRDLVPPLELCKLIPEGEFENSFFIYSYSCDKRITEPFLDRRDDTEYCRRNMVNAPAIYPAPTLQELIVALSDITLSSIKVCKSFGAWHVECYVWIEYGERFISADSSKNASTAALKVWLTLKGIEA